MGASRKSAKVSKTLKRFRESTIASGRKGGAKAMVVAKGRKKGA